jgi:6-phosphogluconolactonase (cycloisomerase 2 family)
VLSADDRHLYVISRDEDALSAFERDPVTGELALIDVQVDGVNGADGLNGGRAIVISPDGRDVYTLGGSGPEKIGHFHRDANTGVLTFAATYVVYHNGGMAISPDGAHLYVSQYLGIAIFGRDASSGALTSMGEYIAPETDPAAPDRSQSATTGRTSFSPTVGTALSRSSREILRAVG